MSWAAGSWVGHPVDADRPLILGASDHDAPAARYRELEIVVPAPVTVIVPNHLMPRLVGPLNENLRLVEDAFSGTRILTRGNEFTIDGADAELAARLVDELRLLLEQGQVVDPQVVHRTIDMVRADERPSEVLTSEVLRSARGRSVRPKTSGQKRYADAIRDNVITFGI
jgi:phosphate starvation-inducible PhoH-like protein